MPSEPSAEVVFQDGWATIRMQIPISDYLDLKYLVIDSNLIWSLLDEGEREKHDRSEIMARFDDVPTVD